MSGEKSKASEKNKEFNRTTYPDEYDDQFGADDRFGVFEDKHRRKRAYDDDIRVLRAEENILKRNRWRLFFLFLVAVAVALPFLFPLIWTAMAAAYVVICFTVAAAILTVGCISHMVQNKHLFPRALLVGIFIAAGIALTVIFSPEIGPAIIGVLGLTAGGAIATIAMPILLGVIALGLSYILISAGIHIGNQINEKCFEGGSSYEGVYSHSVSIVSNNTDSTENSSKGNPITVNTPASSADTDRDQDSRASGDLEGIDDRERSSGSHRKSSIFPETSRDSANDAEVWKRPDDDPAEEETSSSRSSM